MDCEKMCMQEEKNICFKNTAENKLWLRCDARACVCMWCATSFFFRVLLLVTDGRYSKWLWMYARACVCMSVCPEEREKTKLERCTSPNARCASTHISFFLLYLLLQYLSCASVLPCHSLQVKYIVILIFFYDDTNLMDAIKCSASKWFGNSATEISGERRETRERVRDQLALS